jgi:hypothetical protein
MCWFKDNKPLKDDYRIDIYNDRGARYLEICDAKLEDSGEYTIVDRKNIKKLYVSTKVNVIENKVKIKRPNIQGLYMYGSR